MMLTVNDVVRLAQAGVKVDLSDLKNCIEPDAALPDKNICPTSLEDAFWQRWQRAHIKRIDHFEFSGPPYVIHAHEFAEIVYVMVCPQKQPPFIIEDRAPCYPSDALMAALSLYESTNP